MGTEQKQLHPWHWSWTVKSTGQKSDVTCSLALPGTEVHAHLEPQNVTLCADGTDAGDGDEATPDQGEMTVSLEEGGAHGTGRWAGMSGTSSSPRTPMEARERPEMDSLRVLQWNNPEDPLISGFGSPDRHGEN